MPLQHVFEYIRSIALAALAIITLLVLIQSSFSPGSRDLKTTTRQSLQAIGQLTPQSLRNHGSRVVKATSIIGPDNDLYEGALRSHEEHNRKHGYDMEVLRKTIVNRFWSTPTWLLSLVVAELIKPEDTRAEWLMFLGPDIILLNPQIPVEIFLPPADFSHVHFLGTQAQDGFDCDVFFLRIHDWSVKVLTEVLNAPNVHEELQTSEHKVGKAFASVLRSDQFRNHVSYQPRKWYNAYQLDATTSEGMPGNLLVHYHEVSGDKWSAMADMIAKRPESRRLFSMPLDETAYLQEIREYWDRIRKAYRLLNLPQARSVDDKVYNAVRRLQYATTYEADDEKKMLEAMAGFQDTLGMRDDEKLV